MISYLPLSHVAGLMLDVVAAVVCGNTVWFAQHYALKGCIVTTLDEVRLTIFLGVPWVWEKFMDKVVINTSRVTGIKGYLLSKSRVCSARIQQWIAFTLLPCFPGSLSCIFPSSLFCCFLPLFHFSCLISPLFPFFLSLLQSYYPSLSFPFTYHFSLLVPFCFFCIFHCCLVLVHVKDLLVSCYHVSWEERMRKNA